MALAVKRTGNLYGITLGGSRYVAPAAGMRVTLDRTKSGLILEVLKPLRPGGDPETKIQLDSGETIYRFQTALSGYSVATKYAR